MSDEINPDANAPEQANNPDTAGEPPVDGGDTAAKPDDKGGADTVLANPGDIEVKAPADWPEDWAAKMAGGDEKEMATLSRFKSPVELAKAYREAQKKISSGQLKEDNPFPADGTDEEKAAWRKANKLPETTDGYYEGLPKGLVVGDDDKPMVDSFAEMVLGEGGSQAEFNRAISAYYKIQEQNAAAQQQFDQQQKIQAEEELRAEWGANYRPEVQAIFGMFETAPEGVKEAFLSARDGEGLALASNANVIRWLADIRQQVNPAATVVPGGNGNAQSVTDRIAEIEKLMADRSSEYYVGPRSKELSAEYRKLIEAKEKMDSRSR
jgi:hypothetical protein